LNKKQTLPRGILALIIILAVIIIDQVVKLYIKTHYYLGEDVEVTSFFHLRFIQNNGMAFGMELGSKLFLTLFRTIVVGALISYIYRIRKNLEVPCGYIVCLALIIAGAAGNIIDCVFYGAIFDNPYPPMVAEFVPFGTGYASILYGQVVDMLYFPLFSFNWPDWLPIIGGKEFSFFDPVFNIADAAISVGVIMLIFFYSKYIGQTSENKKCD
jgi:signal peptidase II